MWEPFRVRFSVLWLLPHQMESLGRVSGLPPWVPVPGSASTPQQAHHQLSSPPADWPLRTRHSVWPLTCVVLLNPHLRDGEAEARSSSSAPMATHGFQWKDQDSKEMPPSRAGLLRATERQGGHRGAWGKGRRGAGSLAPFPGGLFAFSVLHPAEGVTTLSREAGGSEGSRSCNRPGSRLFLLRAAPAAYEGSHTRGRMRAAAAGLHHSHSHAGSEPRLGPTPQPQPQPRRIRAASGIYTTAHSNTRSLTH